MARTAKPPPPEWLGHVGSQQRKRFAYELRRLRPDYRRCFELFYRDELSVAEVGQRLDVPQGTVKTWLHRARKELAEHLERRGVMPGNEP